MGVIGHGVPAAYVSALVGVAVPASAVLVGPGAGPRSGPRAVTTATVR